jgi:tRNA threonylcarbamoyladenosine biosynthesis protein TsaE
LWEFRSSGPAATEKVGYALGRLLKPGDTVSLVGELGAGKTVFVHGAAAGLDVVDTVSSPSFLIVQEYRGRLTVFHCDFYRLDSYQELEDIGWDDYFSRGGVILIEWGNRIPEALPESYLEVVIDRGRVENERLLRFIPHGSRYGGLVKELADRCASWE